MTTEDKDRYMGLAIKAAMDAKHKGGVAIGAVLVEDATGRVISTGGSLVGPTKDPTAHAEVNCVRHAARILHSDDLYGYTLFSTLEPCHMCLSTAAWAKIPHVYFGAYRKDVDRSLFDIKGNFSDEQEAKRMNLREHKGMLVHGGVLEQECAGLLDGYHSFARHS